MSLLLKTTNSTPISDARSAFIRLRNNWLVPSLESEEPRLSLCESVRHFRSHSRRIDSMPTRHGNRRGSPFGQSLRRRNHSSPTPECVTAWYSPRVPRLRLATRMRFYLWSPLSERRVSREFHVSPLASSSPRYLFVYVRLCWPGSSPIFGGPRESGCSKRGRRRDRRHLRNACVGDECPSA